MGASFVLYRRDRTLLARYPHAEAIIGKPFGGTDNFDRAAGVLDTGVLRMTSTMDGEDRLVAPHNAAHYPLIIAVTDRVDTVLGLWRSEVRVFAGTAGLLELVIVAIVLLGVRHLRHAERIEAVNAGKLDADSARIVAEAELALSRERERSEHDLHKQYVRFETALGNMLQGLIMVDHAGTLLVVNRRFCELAGVPPGTITAGMSYAEMARLVVSIGNVRPEGSDGLQRRRRELGRWECACYVHVGAYGRPHLQRDTPADGGRLAHHLRGHHRAAQLAEARDRASGTSRCIDLICLIACCSVRRSNTLWHSHAVGIRWRCTASTLISSGAVERHARASGWRWPATGGG